MTRHHRSPVASRLAGVNLLLAGWLVVSPAVFTMGPVATVLSVATGGLVALLAGYNRWIASERRRASPPVALAALVVAHAALLIPALARASTAATVSVLATGAVVASLAGVNLTDTRTTRGFAAGAG